jgi:hypothetical protein
MTDLMSSMPGWGSGRISQPAEGIFDAMLRWRWSYRSGNTGGLLRLVLKEGFNLTAPQVPIVRIIPVIAHAVGVFGDEHKASHWLSTPLPLLENRAPSELLNSEEGIQRVDQILTRIEHNIFS